MPCRISTAEWVGGLHAYHTLAPNLLFAQCILWIVSINTDSIANCHCIAQCIMYNADSATVLKIALSATTALFSVIILYT